MTSTLKCLKKDSGQKVKIHVDPEARPKLLKARPVPYAVKGKIEVGVFKTDVCFWPIE